MNGIRMASRGKTSRAVWAAMDWGLWVQAETEFFRFRTRGLRPGRQAARYKAGHGSSAALLQVIANASKLRKSKTPRRKAAASRNPTSATRQ
jgi:hypothetical protein